MSYNLCTVVQNRNWDEAEFGKNYYVTTRLWNVKLSTIDSFLPKMAADLGSFCQSKVFSCQKFLKNSISILPQCTYFVPCTIFDLISEVDAFNNNSVQCYSIAWFTKKVRLGHIRKVKYVIAKVGCLRWKLQKFCNLLYDTAKNTKNKRTRWGGPASIDGVQFMYQS